MINGLSGVGKNIVILGINSTLGLAIEEVLLKFGFNVYGTYFNTVIPDMPNRVRFDFRDPSDDQLDALFTHIPEQVYAVVNCAVPPYEDNDPRVNEVTLVYSGLIEFFNRVTIRLEEWGKIIHIGGQTVETSPIPGASVYTEALMRLHKWGMEFNERFAQESHFFFVSYCLGMTNTRELDTWSLELIDTYRAKVPTFVEPSWVALSVGVNILIPYPPVKLVWSPKSFMPLVVR